MNENRNLKKGVGIHARRFIAYVVLAIVSVLCLFWFYVLFINATRSNGELAVRFYIDSEQPSLGKLEKLKEWNTSGVERYDQQSDHFILKCSIHVFIFRR